MGVIMKKINSEIFLAGSTIECDGVTGIGTEFRDSPEEERINSTWRRALWKVVRKKALEKRYQSCISELKN